MKIFFRNNGLSMTLLTLFFIFWIGQAWVGRLDYNDDRAKLGARPLPMSDYLRSDHFLEATMENWESEFLQMAAYVVFTAFLFQKGSSESKDPDQTSPQDEDPRAVKHTQDTPWPVRQGGWVLKIYENSLGLAFAILFLASWMLHAKGGAGVYSEEQIASGHPAVSFVGYLQTPHFWFESLQNWQSEFLAMSAMVILSIYLRQRGSPESKPVAASHFETGDED